jgi:L-lactate utilization protein LutC
MSEKKVLEQEEMKSIEDLRNQSTDLIFQFGQVEMEILITEKRLEQLKTAKVDLETRYTELQSAEEQVIQDLTGKYGAGQLNVENGEFVAS